MDLLAEYDEFAKLPAHTAVTYKFFSLFRVADGNLQWRGVPTPISPEAADALKAFLRAQRSALKGGVTASDCSRRMWFWYQKLLELGLFDQATLDAILRWMEICELVVA